MKNSSVKYVLVLVSMLLGNICVRAQDDFTYCHDYEFTSVSANAILGKSYGYRLDVFNARVHFINIGLYSVFSEQIMDPEAGTWTRISQKGYFLPVGLNFPLMIKNDYRLSLNSNLYWSENPKQFELEVRSEKPYYSFFAGYRFRPGNDNNLGGIYAGFSVGLHRFFNYRIMSEQKRNAIQNTLCSSKNENCVMVDFSKKNELLVYANLRAELHPLSPVSYLEEEYRDLKILDSSFFNRSINLLKDIQNKIQIDGMKGVTIYLLYGAATSYQMYDTGPYAVTKPFPGNLVPRSTNDYLGFSRGLHTTIGPAVLYTTKIKMVQLNELNFNTSTTEYIRSKCRIQSNLQIYLQELEKVSDKK
jgi:hypothetical protein